MCYSFIYASPPPHTHTTILAVSHTVDPLRVFMIFSDAESNFFTHFTVSVTNEDASEKHEHFFSWDTRLNVTLKAADKARRAQSLARDSGEEGNKALTLRREC